MTLAFLRAFGLALIKAVLIVFGLFVVAVLIPFRRTDEATRLPNGWVFSDIDALMFFDPDHCRTSYESELERKQLPKAYQ